MKKALITGTLFLTLSLATTACGTTSGTGSSSSGKEAKEIKIGSLHPLSGAQATDGSQMENAIKMAIEEINKAGGIKSLGGAKLTLVEGDSENKPEKGVSEVQRMVREGAVSVIGTYTSGVAVTATQEAERQKIPFLIDIASADQITERGFKYTFRLQPPAQIIADNFLTDFKALNEKTGNKLKTVVLDHEDSVFGTGIATYIEKNASKAGIQVVGNLAHPANALDLTSEVTKIKSLNPDVVVVTSYLSDGELLTKSLAQSGFHPKAIIGVANGAYSNAKFISSNKDINQYIMDVNYTINPKSELAKKVREEYKKNYNQDLSPNAAYAYTAVKVLVDAIERAGSSDKDKIREALAKTNFTEHILPQGPIVFDEKGQNKNAQAVLSQIVNGESLVVYPDQYKQADPVFPMPTK